jgi:hypothetical protein
VMVRIVRGSYVRARIRRPAAGPQIVGEALTGEEPLSRTIERDSHPPAIGMCRRVVERH